MWLGYSDFFIQDFRPWEAVIIIIIYRWYNLLRLKFADSLNLISGRSSALDI